MEGRGGDGRGEGWKKVKDVRGRRKEGRDERGERRD